MKKIKTKKEELFPPVNDVIINKSFSKILSKKFLDYSVSVITDRSIPDIKDGLKPVQRRLLFTLNNYNTTRTVKSSKVVGECMGK
jgi:DNA gyrase/topoisomerase IV subunit A